MESKLPRKDLQHKKEREQVLIAYLEGQLSPQEEHDLWAYLIQDASMYEELVHLANVKEVLLSGSHERQAQSGAAKLVGSGEVKDRVEKGSIWKGVAAILGAVALLLSLYWGFSTPDSYDDLALDLSPKEQLDTKVYRGEVEQNGIKQNGAEQDTDPILLEVQALVAADEYGLAIELINELLGNETRAAVLSLWTRIDLEVAKGMYTYNLGDKDEALEVFLEVEQILDKVEADSMQSEGRSLTRLAEKRDNVYWVIAQSYYAMNEPALAVNYFEKIVALDGSYSRAAANYIQALKAD